MEENKGFKEFLCSSVGKAVMIVMLYVVILGLLMLCVNIFDNSEAVGLIFALALGVFGWKALNRIQPSMFLFLPLAGWVLYFVIKGLLSIVVGVFAAPFVIAKKITKSIQANL